MNWNVGYGFNFRNSAIQGSHPEFSVMGGVEDFDFGVLVSPYEGALDLAWNYEGEKSLRSTAGISLNNYWDNGGLWTLYADCGQDFRFWNAFALRYRVGLQIGLSWSPYSPDLVPFSFSPYAYWAIGYEGDFLHALVYGHGRRQFEHTFQAPPVLGFDLGWDVDEHNTFNFDAFIKLADYIEGPDLVITDLAFRLSYVYRGETV